MFELVRTPQYLLHCDFQRGLVVLERTATPFDAIDELVPCFDRLEKALAAVDRKQQVLLVDTRNAPLRQDPEFERAFESQRKRVVAGFARVAVLVRTAAGRLQVKKHSRIDRSGVRDFDDEAEALAYLGIYGTTWR